MGTTPLPPVSSSVSPSVVEGKGSTDKTHDDAQVVTSTDITGKWGQPKISCSVGIGSMHLRCGLYLYIYSFFCSKCALAAQLVLLLGWEKIDRPRKYENPQNVMTVTSRTTEFTYQKQLPNNPFVFSPFTDMQLVERQKQIAPEVYVQVGFFKTIGEE